MGGKSSSSQQANTTQTTQTSSGVNTGLVAQGTTVNVTQDFTKEIQDTFNKALNLLGDTINIAAEAGGQALNVVSQRLENQENPQLAAAKETTPLYMVLAGGLVLAMIMKAK